MLQVYFDFSGYSDMAIGLGKILGFDFLENFNYPFIAKSISEFWQRWHISMGTWFREYIYIPLGGNRVSMLKRVRNIAAVWLVTGLWHGAAWNFILWGGFFAIVLALEKIFFMKHLERLPAVVRRIYVILILIFSFVIFHIESFSGIVAHFKGMCGLGGISLVNAESLYYLKSYAFVLVISATGATPILRNAVKKAKIHPFSSALVDVFTPIFMLAVLLIVTAYMVDSSFSPFLYFRF
jgi:alginate O-acetyltransferase complex protein AlgI